MDTRIAVLLSAALVLIMTVMQTTELFGLAYMARSGHYIQPYTAVSQSPQTQIPPKSAVNGTPGVGGC